MRSPGSQHSTGKQRYCSLLPEALQVKPPAGAGCGSPADPWTQVRVYGSCIAICGGLGHARDPSPHPCSSKVLIFLKSLNRKLEALIIVTQNKWKSWNCLPFVVWIQVRSGVQVPDGEEGLATPVVSRGWGLQPLPEKSLQVLSALPHHLNLELVFWFCFFFSLSQLANILETFCENSATRADGEKF